MPTHIKEACQHTTHPCPAKEPTLRISQQHSGSLSHFTTTSNGLMRVAAAEDGHRRHHCPKAHTQAHWQRSGGLYRAGPTHCQAAAAAIIEFDIGTKPSTGSRAHSWKASGGCGRQRGLQVQVGWYTQHTDHLSAPKAWSIPASVPHSPPLGYAVPAHALCGKGLRRATCTARTSPLMDTRKNRQQRKQCAQPWRCLCCSAACWHASW